MGERVHPYVGAEVTTTPVNGLSSLESNPEKHEGFRVPAEAPTGAHREQEQSLIGNQAPSNQGPAGDGDRGRRRRRLLRCCCWLGAIGGICMMMMGILLLLLFLLLQPKLPKFSITAANMTSFRTSRDAQGEGGGGGALSLNADMEFTVRVRNPNKKIGIDYRSVTAALMYEGVVIGEGWIPAFYQGYRNTTLVQLALAGNHILLTSELGATLTESLANADSLSLRARAISRVRIRIGRWTSRTSKVRVKCQITISNPARANVRLLQNTCKFKLLRLRL